MKPGEYTVQALLHVYETFRRSDGHVVKLPPDRGEGQQWQTAPGNLTSTPRKIRIDPASAEPISIVLDRKLPPVEPVQDTKYVKHIRLQSERLTKFWGRPMYLGAIVLLLWIPLRQRPGLGTVSNVVVIGLAIDAALVVLPTPSPLWARMLFLAAGVLYLLINSALTRVIGVIEYRLSPHLRG